MLCFSKQLLLGFLELSTFNLLPKRLMPFCIQSLLISLLQVDRLVESEEARLEEKKEAEYKPVVMGKP